MEASSTFRPFAKVGKGENILKQVGVCWCFFTLSFTATVPKRLKILAKLLHISQSQGYKLWWNKRSDFPRTTTQLAYTSLHSNIHKFQFEALFRNFSPVQRKFAWTFLSTLPKIDESSFFLVAEWIMNSFLRKES